MTQERIQAIINAAQRVADGTITVGEGMNLFGEICCFDALMQADGNACKAARHVGLHRNSFSRYVAPHLRELARKSTNGGAR